VCHRDHRDDDSHQPPDLGREHPAGVDDGLGVDSAVIGFHGPDPAALHLDPRHSSVRADLGAAAPGALGQSERQLARVDVAVGREVSGAEHALRGHRREELSRLIRRDKIERETERLRPARLAREFLHALLGRGQS
jgi:hypothetical protein